MRRTGPVVLCLGLAAAAAPASAANDPGVELQWGMARVGAETAWATSRGAGATIAIVDTGIDLDHEDLEGRVLPGRDFVDDDDVAQDEEGHGTHVAGIAAAAANNGLGVVGVAPEALLVPVRVLDGKGQGTLDDVAAGIRWATEQGVDVINLSLGPERTDLEPSPASGAALRAAIDQAWDAGIIVILAAGNDEALGLTDTSPAVVVGATDRDDRSATYATDGDNELAGASFAMVAPGGATGDTAETCATSPVGILSTYRDDAEAGSYACLAGTSMAAPHVAGTAALLRALGLDHVATRDRLLATAVDLGDPGADPVFGAGRLDVASAVAGGETAARPPQVASTTVATASTSAAPGSGSDSASVGGDAPPASIDLGRTVASDAVTVSGTDLSSGGPGAPATVAPAAIAAVLLLAATALLVVTVVRRRVPS